MIGPVKVVRHSPVLPVILQYYYKVDGCKATRADDPACICWHDEGTGPLASEIHQRPYWARDWRIRRGYRGQPQP